MREILKTAPVTSAHNYLIADRDRAEMWEVFPTLRRKQSAAEGPAPLTLLHTNHCLDTDTAKIEAPLAVASTTRERFALLSKKAPAVTDLKSFYGLLTDHENEPKSICSHYQSGALDPSTTCGGSVGDLGAGAIRFWRGCPVYDANYREIELTLNPA